MINLVKNQSVITTSNISNHKEIGVVASIIQPNPSEDYPEGTVNVVYPNGNTASFSPDRVKPLHSTIVGRMLQGEDSFTMASVKTWFNVEYTGISRSYSTDKKVSICNVSIKEDGTPAHTPWTQPQAILQLPIQGTDSWVEYTLTSCQAKDNPTEFYKELQDLSNWLESL